MAMRAVILSGKPERTRSLFTLYVGILGFKTGNKGGLCLFRYLSTRQIHVLYGTLGSQKRLKRRPRMRR